MTFDGDRDGLSKNDRDLNMNLASPSKLAIELVPCAEPSTLPSFVVFDGWLVRRSPVEIFSKN